MSAPDHRPYLREGDLRTAEDVLAWLIEYPGTDAAQASIDLDERLDRERRQACRRAALQNFETFAAYLRWFPTARRMSHECVCARLLGAEPSLTDAAATARAVIDGYLADALAFRAAARTP